MANWPTPGELVNTG
uniref:La ribonucleoprotein 1B n=3 Tax=Muroidea TaxID=337687 RepID=A0A8C6R9V6_NANGA